MRTAWLLGRLCFRHASQPLRSSSRRLFFTIRQYPPRKGIPKRPIGGTILLSTLGPAAFVKLSEDHNDGKTGEAHMLEASRAELLEKIPDNVHGLKRVWRGLVFMLDQYITEPFATGVRFLYLIVIFVPVIFAVPVIWIGGRQEKRDNERSGTLWWYGFLVHSMERAGPAFIKVGQFVGSIRRKTAKAEYSLARSMGGITPGHISYGNVQSHVFSPFQCPSTLFGGYEENNH